MLRLIQNFWYWFLGDSSNWHPKNFSDVVHAELGPTLSELGFNVLESGNPDFRNREDFSSDSIAYSNPITNLIFWWNRQEMDGDILFIDPSLLPIDPSLEIDDISAKPEGLTDSDQLFSIVSIISFLKLQSDTKRFFVRQNTPMRFWNDIKKSKMLLPQLQEFFEGELVIYIPFRRWLVIRQLQYTWDMRDAYKDTQVTEQKTMERCRTYYALWLNDGDYRSAVQVLEIIEEIISPSERKQLRTAKKRTKKQTKYPIRGS